MASDPIGADHRGQRGSDRRLTTDRAVSDRGPPAPISAVIAISLSQAGAIRAMILFFRPISPSAAKECQICSGLAAGRYTSRFGTRALRDAGKETIESKEEPGLDRTDSFRAGLLRRCVASTSGRSFTQACARLEGNIR
jgi:hypothetical protein